MVVGGADEGEEAFEGRLVEDADAGEGGGAEGEVGVGGGEVAVQLGKGDGDVEVGGQEAEGVVFRRVGKGCRPGGFVV